MCTTSSPNHVVIEFGNDAVHGSVDAMLILQLVVYKGNADGWPHHDVIMRDALGLK